MQTPNGIAIDSKNNIYVADLVLDRVNQYVLVDTSNAEGVQPAAPGASRPARPRASAALIHRSAARRSAPVSRTLAPRAHE